MKKISISLVTLIFSAQSFAMSCLGTEPFWSAEVSNTGIKYQNLVDEIQSIEITAVDMAKEFLQVYSNSKGPVAVITYNTCNDFMSDNVYEKEVILFTKTGVRYGCCEKVETDKK